MTHKSANPLVRQSEMITLHEHIDDLLTEMNARLEQRFTEMNARIEQRFMAQEQAVKAALESTRAAACVAEENTEKWRANANEWRAAMNDRERQFLTRTVYETGHDNILRRIDELEKMRDIAQGKASQNSVLFVAFISLVGFLISVIDYFVKAK